MVDLKFVNKLTDDVPAKLMVYTTQRPRYSQRAVMDTMNKLHLPELTLPENLRFSVPPDFRHVDNWTIGRHGAFTVALNKRSGAMRFRDEMRYGREMEGTFHIPEQRLVDHAREFVNKSNLIQIPADRLNLGKVTYLRSQGASTEGEVTPEQILDAGVVFTREIDGIPVRGPGGYLMVNIAADESIVGGTKIWRHRDERVGSVPVLKPDYALEALEKRLVKRDLKEPVKVLKADFCYFEAEDNKAQRYLEPTYAFLFETKIGEFRYKSVEIIPATRKPRQRWNFHKNFLAPETIRAA